MADTRDLEPVLAELLAAATRAERGPAEMRQFRRMLAAAAPLIEGPASSLDVKIAGTTLEEMVRAFGMFAPYRDVRKVTMFGSARTTPDNPIYGLATEAARAVAEAGFMVVTGAGPGIMEAGMRGAGVEKSIGVSIRLPFETTANSVIAGDDKYVSMRYFFTRKLMLVKESHAFLCMPGGFGTLDETFELLTLAQTAKSVPVPIVMLEVAGDPFWSPLMERMEPLLVQHGLISASDTTLYTITDSVTDAVEEIVGFYANYHSIRYVEGRLFIRVHRPLPGPDMTALSERFAHLSADGSLVQGSATAQEIADDDVPDLVRIGLDYTAKGFADLRPLIDALNRY